jgi:hypothetical protein
VAKRFTDTKKWKDPWFDGLPLKMKVAWQFMCDDCDGSGVWKVNLRELQHRVGESFTHDELKAHLADHVVWLRDDKLWLKAFIRFQYKTLKVKNNAHRGIMKQILEQTQGLPLDEETSALIQSFADALSTLNRPSNDSQSTLDQGSTDPTGKGKGEGRGKGKGKGEGGAGGNIASGMDQCVSEWKATLEHFEIGRPYSERDEIELARGIQSFGAAWVVLALQGARKQKAGRNFDPKQFVSLRTYLHKDKIERLVNLGAGKESADGFDWGAFWAGQAS